MDQQKAISELERYIRNEYEGRIDFALESIGGVRCVRQILGWEDFAVLDSRLYRAPEVL